MVHECSDCTFVADAGNLLTYFVPREKRDSAGNKPVFVGKFTMTDWAGHSGFYLFKCPDCGDVCVDYPHGYRDNGCLYIRCGRCRFEIILSPGKYKDIYRREQVVSPPTVLQELRGLWKARKQIKDLRRTAGEIEDKHGVKVLVSGEDIRNVSNPVGNVQAVGLFLLFVVTALIFIFLV
ncbi:MAG: hypothetical protein A3I26_02800 [Candidatus Yanofskybacteria bacterium RIFCSPLOWO2_02_FULL_43_10]|uniref:Uncharacterized protein n=1 Tax=Candidatus Yanofskybacteria bacterium RIFCSPLOWO2_12_FULL_43_11b TaxID=1802710 RepID=A0A1F8H9M4_9BACT|nr:MAG: hypothetical protein A2742_01725 [Candidatus Yanofskybacteria bacterium RIFCSPHIGHO2_01_FULL_43_32]OGN11877.1 MAG: hypothetical protein A3C69_01670 [Candidatus Yanofskybacteria bacterium RIFCSPHIGHO2_02_FULL_43_12]OGN18087.1 MAG: hypothetical protein A3E34_02355 [Candidatus Yanofskybacteria bacterium RIFCSPHIGHO2_12_FULL_43_11]OGN25325.1 MAG: hypothetical protein A2923_01515 [Candidatus Yanofskybacteria bacterium RIFCSPLOWO2_01_FULL_43_46]OGN28609.1 MAG: hypothetical protein A3I26_02800